MNGAAKSEPLSWLDRTLDCETLVFRELLNPLFELANGQLSRLDFLREVTSRILRFVGCDRLELWAREGERTGRWRAAAAVDGTSFRAVASPAGGKKETPLDGLLRRMVEGRLSSPPECFCPHGSFRSGDMGRVLPSHGGSSRPRYASQAWLPVPLGLTGSGLLVLQWKRRGAVPDPVVERLEGIARILGVCLANHRTRSALNERVKELICLSGIARAAGGSERTLDEVLRDVVELLPSALQFPGRAEARIVLDHRSYATAGYQEGPYRLTGALAFQDAPRGRVEVVYTSLPDGWAEAPFLDEERSFLRTAAQEIGAIVEMKLAERERTALHGQLRHADRLATIGQLSAGVAHELNEPLSSILGFAQLCSKHEGLPQDARRDLERIVAAAMRARDITKKLMLFAREHASERRPVSLNQVVEEVFSFLEARTQRSHIEVACRLQEDLPFLEADANQLHQVLVNLAVNAIQAMPDGGRLTVETSSDGSSLLLAVEDEGVGMSAQVMERIFDPFFTTKDVGEGTGLGLSVVHGIVASHGGSIRVNSQPGQGARFEVRLPFRPDAELESEEER